MTDGALVALRIRRENAIAAEINAALADDPAVQRWAEEHADATQDAVRVACRLHDTALPQQVAARTRELLALAMTVGSDAFRRAMVTRCASEDASICCIGGRRNV